MEVKMDLDPANLLVNIKSSTIAGLVAVWSMLVAFDFGVMYFNLDAGRYWYFITIVNVSGFLLCMSLHQAYIAWLLTRAAGRKEE
jgi:hypothetical protein